MSVLGKIADTPEIIRNVNNMIVAFREAGITSPTMIAAGLAVSAKESTFKPVAENCYTNTSPSNIRTAFPSAFGNWSDSQINNIKGDCVAFFNHVYGGRYGTPQNEGYKYRGRGYNQITFLDNYRSVGNEIGVDLVRNPDALLDSRTAARAQAAYYIIRFRKHSNWTKHYFGTSDFNKPPNLQAAIKLMAHLTAGTGHSPSATPVQRGIDNANKHASVMDAYVRAVGNLSSWGGGQTLASTAIILGAILVVSMGLYLLAK